MWVPKHLVNLLQANKDTVDALREELAAVRAERDILHTQVTVSQNSFEWLRLRVNSLEMERAQLIQKAYGIEVPVPTVIRQPKDILPMLNQAIFDDMGDKAAGENGLPVYSDR
jgi:hypothetical protein